MRKLYVAATEASRSAFECERAVIDFDNANFTQVSIAVMTLQVVKRSLKAQKRSRHFS